MQVTTHRKLSFPVFEDNLNQLKRANGVKRKVSCDVLQSISFKKRSDAGFTSISNRLAAIRAKNAAISSSALNRSYKVVYFDLRGLFEGCRLMLHYLGVPFEDERWQIKDFHLIKNKMKYGQLPYLEIDGERRIYQHTAIIRFLAEEFGLAGKDKFEKALVNEILDFHKESYATLLPYTYSVVGFREGNPTELREKIYVPNAPRIFAKFETLLEESGSGWLVPSGVTFVDFMVADWLHLWSTNMEPTILGDHPKLAAYVQRVYTLPGLEQYLANRKPF